MEPLIDELVLPFCWNVWIAFDIDQVVIDVLAAGDDITSYH